MKTIIVIFRRTYDSVQVFDEQTISPEWSFFVDDVNGLSFVADDGNVDALYANDPEEYQVGEYGEFEWYCVAYVRDARRHRLYRNGELVAEAAIEARNVPITRFFCTFATEFLLDPTYAPEINVCYAHRAFSAREVRALYEAYMNQAEFFQTL